MTDKTIIVSSEPVTETLFVVNILPITMSSYFYNNNNHFVYILNNKYY